MQHREQMTEIRPDAIELPPTASIEVRWPEQLAE
jgi:hypothetical protein